MKERALVCWYVVVSGDRTISLAIDKSRVVWIHPRLSFPALDRQPMASRRHVTLLQEDEGDFTGGSKAFARISSTGFAARKTAPFDSRQTSDSILLSSLVTPASKRQGARSGDSRPPALISSTSRATDSDKTLNVKSSAWLRALLSSSLMRMRKRREEASIADEDAEEASIAEDHRSATNRTREEAQEARL